MKKNIIAMIACLAVIANVCGCTNKVIVEESVVTEEEYQTSKTPVFSNTSSNDKKEEVKPEFLEPVIIPSQSLPEITPEFIVPEETKAPSVEVRTNTDAVTPKEEEEVTEEKEEITYKYIALTFDDGPGKYTSELLDILEEYDASATFFVVGERLNYYEDEIKDIVESGCEIGIHTYSHTSFTTLGVEGMLEEIDKTRSILDEIGVEYTNLVRPPYGNMNDEIKQGAQFPLILWNVDTRDWESKNAQSVCEEILKGIKEGNIILLHDIHSTTIEGVKLALEQLDSEYKFVSVTQLAQITNTSLENGTAYYTLKLK